MTTSRDIPVRPSVPVSTHEMHGHAPAGAPDTWIFNIEAVATLGIAAWYALGVFIGLGVLPHNRFYTWGSQWFVPFLLGVFYLGAGYLYQRHQHIGGVKAWGRYMRREAIVLATPFVAFTVLTLATNSALHASPALTPADLGRALTVSPVVPVGYFQVLFVIYVIARTPRTTCGMVALLVTALAAKLAVVAASDAGLAASWPYLLQELPGNWIWFVAGSGVRFFKLEGRLATPMVAVGTSLAFVACGALLFAAAVRTQLALFALTALGLLAFFALSAACFATGRQNAFFGFVTRYTMAIWLMHEILAKLTMAGLGALGFSATGAFAAAAPAVNAVGCLAACYALPVLVMWALSKVWKLGFIVYPSRYLPKDL